MGGGHVIRHVIRWVDELAEHRCYHVATCASLESGT